MGGVCDHAEGGDMQDRVCVVTGGASGIGRAGAMMMAERGGRVVVSDVDDATGEATVGEITAAGGEAVYVHCDVRSRDDIMGLMEAAVDAFGGIDLLHNNAGIHESAIAEKLTVHELDEEVWEAVYEINLRGTWLCTKYAAPHLLASKRSPAIVNAASTGGVLGYPMASAYGATKGGVIVLTKTTAVDLGPTVRCNCYCPAAVDTPMVSKYFETADDPDAIIAALVGSHIIPRLGRPEEIAKLVCFLGSDDASWITGQSFIIDGGSLAWRGTNG
jgi:NAD(P)-dependent dehydrogenase (short-subunit alcohol dehydrogenase family)